MHPVVSSRGAPAPRRRVAAFLAAAALFLVAVLPAAAQQAGAVAGVVVSSGGAPLAGTRVTAGPGGAGALTDARGGFRIPGVPAGSVTLRAERIGYAAAEQSLEVPAGGEVRARLVLAERAMELEGVVVSATREARLKSQTAASVGTVSGAEIREVRPAHPAEIVGRVPGVWVSNAGGEGHMTAIRQPRSTKPMYLFLEDGVPTRSTGFFNHNALYEVNLPQAERIEVLKGPATALYGSDAIGGVIGVETRPASLAPQLEGSLERGSGAWTRLLLTASGTAGSDGVRGDLNVTHSDGYRDAMGYDRVSGTVRWDRYLPGSATLKTVATYSTIDQTDGSTVTAADYRVALRRQLQSHRLPPRAGAAPLGGAGEAVRRGDGEPDPVRARELDGAAPLVAALLRPHRLHHRAPLAGAPGPRAERSPVLGRRGGGGGGPGEQPGVAPRGPHLRDPRGEHLRGVRPGRPGLRLRRGLPRRLARTSRRSWSRSATCASAWGCGTTGWGTRTTRTWLLRRRGAGGCRRTPRSGTDR